MKKKICLLGLSILMLCGCGKVPTLSNGEEAVLSLNDGGISINDLFTEMKNSYALETLVNMMDKKILEKEYPGEVEAKKQAAEATVKAMETAYGDNLLTMLRQYYGYQTVSAYQNYLYISSLQSLAIEAYSKSLVTEKEMKKYYEDTIFGDISLSHILITKNTTSSMSDAEKTEAENKAKEKINEIIAELKKSDNPKERFAELAREKSEDAATKDKGGDLGYINLGTLDKNYDEILKVANGLGNGKFSTSIITTELGYHVIFREDQKEKATYEDVQDKIKDTIAETKLTNDKTMQITAMEELRKKYGFKIEDSELSKQYDKYITNAKAELENSSKNS